MCLLKNKIQMIFVCFLFPLLLSACGTEEDPFELFSITNWASFTETASMRTTSTESNTIVPAEAASETTTPIPSPVSTIETIPQKCKSPFVPIITGDTYIYRTTIWMYNGETPTIDNETVFYSSAGPDSTSHSDELVFKYTVSSDLGSGDGQYEYRCFSNGVWENPFINFYQGFRFPAFTTPVIGYSWDYQMKYDNGYVATISFSVTDASSDLLEVTTHDEYYDTVYTWVTDCVGLFKNGMGLARAECFNFRSDKPEEKNRTLFELLEIKHK